MDPRLVALIAALEAEGLELGADLRLRLVLLAGVLGWEDPDGLVAAARAVVVKRKEDRRDFDRVAAAWRASLRPVEPAVEPGPAREWVPTPGAARVGRARRRRRWPWGLVGLVVGLVGVAVWMCGHRVHEPEAPEVEQAPKVVAPPPEVEVPKTVSLWTPVFGQPEAPPVLQRPDALVVGLLCLLALVGLAWRARRRPERPDASLVESTPATWAAAAIGSGPALLLRPVEQEALVWAVARRATEEPSPWLDLDATVAASAEAAGFPQLRFLPARWPAGLWLWVDMGADHPELRRLALEITMAVARANLPVHRAEFLGLPDQLVGKEGPRTPSTASAAERRRRVVVLTDGLAWMDAACAAHTAGSTRVLMRELASWPDLVVVDFGPDRSLSALLAELGVHAVPPERAAAELGELGPAPQRSGGQLARWAAAVALLGEPVDRATALRLRAKLRLEADPWWIGELERAGALDGDPAARAKAVGWLHGAEPVSGAALPEGWEKILAFWREERAGDAHALRLLALWDPLGVDAAIEGLAEEHRGELAWLAAMDDPRHARATVLPWKRADRSAEAQSVLARLGFGAKVGVSVAGEVVLPARRWLGAGLLAGLAVVGIGYGVLAGTTAYGNPGIREEGEAPPVPHWSECRDSVCAAGTRQTSVSTKILNAGEVVSLRWVEMPDQPCTFGLPDGGEVMRCTTGGALSTPPVGRPDYSFIALNTDLGSAEEATAARGYAAALLDGGSADYVVLEPPKVFLDPLHEPAVDAAAQQKLLLGVPPGTNEAKLWDTLRVGLDFKGTRRGRELQTSGLLEQAAEVGEVSQEAGAFIFAGAPLAKPEPAPPPPEVPADPPADPQPFKPAHREPVAAPEPVSTRSELSWVTIPAGEGVIGDDNGKYDDEKPRWRVKFTEPFALLATEVTNRQYAAKNPDHTPVDDKPVVNVNWTEASSFCAAVDGRLPTEAEWEYAARAGSEEDWPFPAGQLADYAWYSPNSGGEVHAVGTRKPNPWGLYDMFGNVYEWVEDGRRSDAYSTYAALTQPVENPGFVNNPSSTLRVVRGGSFGGTPEGLRSSLRDWFRPESEGEVLGFRCARGPRRQPL